MTAPYAGAAASRPGRPLRILEVSQRYFPELGGTETHVHEVSRRLATRAEFQITVFATDRSGSLPRSERGEGFDIVRRRAWPRDRDYYLSPGLIRVIRTGGWDLVHFQGVHTFVPIVGMLAARSARIPYVLTFHTGGHSSAQRSSLRSAQWRALTPLLRGAEALIAVSRFERRLFEQTTGIDPGRFSVIRNGGSLPAAPTDVVPVPGRIVSSGRLERYKGHHKLIEALPALRSRRPETHAVILGSGAYESELWALADRLGVRDAVAIRHIPPGDRALMSQELAAAEVLAALSEYEAHPVGVMEALTLGVTVVGFDIAGIADLVEDGAVIGLDPEASSEVIAEALLAAAQQPRNVPDIDLPTWETSAEAVAETYLRVARPTRPGDPADVPRLTRVHLTTTLTTGGAERQVQLLAGGDPDARVLCLYRAGPMAAALEAAGTPVDILGMEGWRKAVTHLRLARWLRRVRPDVLHVHMLSAQLWGLPAGRLARVPVVLSTEHSIMDTTIEDRPKTAGLRALYLVLERFGQQTVAVSEAAAARLRAWGVAGSRITVVPNAVDLESLRFSTELREQTRRELDAGQRQVILAVGRLTAVKRFDVLLHAAAPLLRGGSSLVVIAGDGPDREALLRLAHGLGIADSVVLLGARPDMPAIFAGADVLVSPSRDETFGLAVVEALANGLPVVYAQCPALDGVELPSVRAVRLSAADTGREVDELTAALTAMLDAARAGEGGAAPDRAAPRELTDRFSVDLLRRRTDQLYVRLAARWKHTAKFEETAL